MKNPYDNKKSIEYKFRLKRFLQIRDIIASILNSKGKCRILDVGGTEKYWSLGDDLIEKNDIRVDLLNVDKFPTTGGKFKSIAGDARDMPDISDGDYDFCHSNSVIEHVGKWEDMKRMAREISRVAPNYFVQTPYFWFPFEPHFRAPFFHWMPEQLRYRLLMKRNLGFRQKRDNVDDAMMSIQSVNLLDRSQFSFLFPDAKIISEKVGFLTKSLMAIKTE